MIIIIPPFGVSELAGEHRAVLHSSDGRYYLKLKIRPSKQYRMLTVPDVNVPVSLCHTRVDGVHTYVLKFMLHTK